MISKSPEDLQYYEDRSKYLRDERGKLLAAREEGREQGEQIGLAKGALAGKVQLLQELLGDMPTTANELQSLSVDILATQFAELQQRLRDQCVGRKHEKLRLKEKLHHRGDCPLETW